MKVAHSSRAAVAGISFDPFAAIGPAPGTNQRIVRAVSEVLERRLFKTAVTFSIYQSNYTSSVDFSRWA